MIGATPRNALIDTIKGAQNTLDTAQATTRTGNSRIRALGAAATALNAVNTANQVAELMANPEKIVSVTIDFNLGTSKSRSDSSEIAQTGLQAGDGGFQVNVQGDTTLKGGAITSTNLAVEDGRNRFDTGGELTLSDIENHARYEADGYQLSVAVTVKGAEPTTPGQKQLAPATQAKTEGSAGIGEDSGQVRSTTRAAISGVAGDKNARTGDQESGIAPIFDQQRVQTEIDAQIKITAEFGKSASTAWGHYANRQFTDAVAEGDEETASCWAPDGACRAGGHALIGGLSGGAAGAAGAGLSSAGAPHVQAFLVANGVPEGAAQAITQLSALGAGIAAGGNAGAAAGFNEVSNNAVQALPLLMEAVVSGGAVAARACLSSPTCLSALRLGGTVLVAKVATLVPPEELAQMPGFGTPNPGQIVPHTERPAPVADGNSSTMTPGTVVDSKGAPPSQGNVPLVGGSSTLTPGVVDGTGPTVVISEGVPTAILDGKGRLPIGIGGLGTPIPRPSTSNPNQTAEEFAKSAFNGQTPTSIAPDVSGPGSWLAKLPDGTSVLYRPAGLGSRTDPTTASVDVNSAGIRAINNGVAAKFKFPRN